MQGKLPSSTESTRVFFIITIFLKFDLLDGENTLQ